MVDSNAKPDKFKSLSADAELESAYEALKKGDYSQCKRIIKNKWPKLKSDVDKTNFNILKIALLHKQKKFTERNALISALKKEFLENPTLSSNFELTETFKAHLRNYNDDAGANEIFKNSMKNLNLSKLGKKEQNKILRELTHNYEFSDLYSKVNAFIKSPNDGDVKFLTLLKYEILYVLVFKIGKLSKKFASNTYQEMIANYVNGALSSEKGMVDILVKYSIALDESNSFLSLFDNKEIPFTNAPVEDIFLEIFYRQGSDEIVVSRLVGSIKSKLDKCNFISYERLVSFIVDYYTKRNIPIEFEKIISSGEDGDVMMSLANPQETLSFLLGFFCNIQTRLADKKTNFNAFKSSILAQLILYHNLISLSKNYQMFRANVFALIRELLDNAISKQSILMELSRFFIYLDPESRASLIERYSTDFSASEITEPDKERIIFYLKLKKMLCPISSLQDAINEIKMLINAYFKLVDGNSKLEKGERILGDDVIILINELFFEMKHYETEPEYVKTSYILLILDLISHERSPYNYDISLFLVRITGYLSLNLKLLEVVKYMNLKGPQFETVSYIAFNNFLSMKSGMQYLIDSLEKWESENKRNTRKTLWKMFTGRNFWNAEELMSFLKENENSYYKYILQFVDIAERLDENSISVHDDDENLQKENFSQLNEILSSIHSSYDAQRLIKNQDVLVSIYKYKTVEFFNENYQSLLGNINYSPSNYKCALDSIGKDNILYRNFPGFKNNFIISEDVPVFGIFDNEIFLRMRLTHRLACALMASPEIKLNQNLKEYAYQYANSVKNYFPQTLHGKIIHSLDVAGSQLIEIYIDCLDDFNKFSAYEADIEKCYALIKDSYIDPLIAIREKINLGDLNSLKLFNFYFGIFKNYFIACFAIITGKYIDFINSNKKSFHNATLLKSKFNSLFKSPVSNFLNDNVKVFETFLNELSTFNYKELIWSNVMTDLGDDTNGLFLGFKQSIDDFCGKLNEDVREILKEIKESSRMFKNFLKDNI